MNWLQLHLSSLKDVLEAAASLFTIAAILIGAIWGYRLFWLKRQKYPRISIEQRIRHISLTPEKHLLNITVNLSNNGDVLVRLKSGEIWVQQVLPLPPNLATLVDKGQDLIGVLRNLIDEDSREMWQTEIPWPMLAQYSVSFLAWHKKEIEPGNSLQLRYDFILNKEVQVIKVYSFYENAAKRPKRIGPIGWRVWRTKKHIVGWDAASHYELKAVGS